MGRQGPGLCVGPAAVIQAAGSRRCRGQGRQAPDSDASRGGVGRLSRWERWGVTPGLPARAAGRQKGPAVRCSGGWSGRGQFPVSVARAVSRCRSGWPMPPGWLYVSGSQSAEQRGSNRAVCVAGGVGVVALAEMATPVRGPQGSVLWVEILLAAGHRG